MTSDRVHREAELLAQALAQRLAAREQSPRSSGPGFGSDARPGESGAGAGPGPGGLTEMITGAALAARGGFDLVGAAVTRWVDAGGIVRPAGPVLPDQDGDCAGPRLPAFQRTPRRVIPVLDDDPGRAGVPHATGHDLEGHAGGPGPG